MFTAYEHTDGRTLVLGKGAARFDERTPKFEHYMAAEFPPAPASMDWYKGITSWGMMMNNTLGCCTISSKGHDLQVCSLNTATEITMTDEQIVQYYSLWDGYVPGNPSTDQGGDVLTVLQDWHRQRMIGHRLLAYASLSPQNTEYVKKAIELFGVVDIGIQLPITAQQQVGGIWDVVGDPGSTPSNTPGSWGGHDVSCGKYETLTASGGASDLFFDLITWGAVQRATLAFLLAYCDELFALLLGMWLDNQPDAPSGFSRDQLVADAQLLAAA